MNLICAQPQPPTLRTPWPSELDVKKAYKSLGDIKAAISKRQQQSLVTLSPEGMAPIDRTVNQLFNGLPILFTEHVTNEKLDIIRKAVKYCFRHPEREYNHDMYDDTIHVFNHVKDAGQVIIYLKLPIALGAGSGKLVSKAWQLRIAKTSGHALRTYWELAARTDIKFPHLLKNRSDEQARVTDAEKEVKYHLQFKHPNICPIFHYRKYRFMEAGQERENVVTYLRFYPKSIRRAIKFAELPADHLEDYARQMLDALAYLHSLNITHGDIKPDNVVTDAGELAYIDFGLINHSVCTKTFESLDYVLNKFIRKGNNTKADLWALGGTLYLMYLSANRDRLAATNNYDIYNYSPPWGLPLHLYDVLENEIFDLKHLKKKNHASLARTKSAVEGGKEVKKPSKGLTDTQSGILHECIMDCKHLKHDIEKLEFNKWTALVPTSFNDFITIGKMIEGFDRIKSKMNFMKESPKEFYHLFALVIPAYQEVLLALDQKFKHIEAILETIPMPPASAKIEGLIWMLLRPRESIPAASALLEAFFPERK